MAKNVKSYVCEPKIWPKNIAYGRPGSLRCVGGWNAWFSRKVRLITLMSYFCEPEFRPKNVAYGMPGNLRCLGGWKAWLVRFVSFHYSEVVVFFVVVVVHTI